jgi:hypothetical protein
VRIPRFALDDTNPSDAVFSTLVLALVVQVVPQSRADSIRREAERQRAEEITRSAVDRARRNDSRDERHYQRRAVTAKDSATAFKDASAREILLLARKARLSQDSALRSYDATTYQRISAGLSFRKLGRDRLVFRTERVDHVQWDRDQGLWLEVKGARTVLPGIPEIGEREAGKGIAQAGEMAAVPYFPGYEPLWIGPMTADPYVTEDGPVHPMAEGSEAYYTFRTGQPTSITLPNGRKITLQELEVRPREPKWNLMIGSMWFDSESGQLVRAAYRFAVPMEIDQFVLEEDPHAFDDVPVWVKPMMFPMRGTVSAVTIEYALYAGRFWLPKTRSAEAIGEASFMRVPAKFEQRFTYESVNSDVKMPALPPLPRAYGVPDSLRGPARQQWIDSARAARAAAQSARRDSVRQGIRRPPPISQCDTSNYRITVSRGYGDSRIPVATRAPCNTDSLAFSPDLPASIYDAGDELFDLKGRAALIEEALSMGVQPPITFNPKNLPPPVIGYGLPLTRYNRVEGISTGLYVSQIIGGGYTLEGTGRFGFSDHKPNVDLSLKRSNLTRSYAYSGYTHLVSAGDWGNPLNFGSSFAALAFGRDEGFYYRAIGAQVAGRTEQGTPVEWRFFVERQSTASQETAYSLAGDNSLPNIVAREGTYPGAALRVRKTFGLNPEGHRLFTDLRLEGAGGDSLFGRGALDLTLTEQIGWLSTALTASGGSSVGGLPMQRQWFLGGTHSIRGQSPDTAQHGNAFWRGRLELGTTVQGARPVLFGDLGWVGDRDSMSKVGLPLSGVGVGASMMDGLIRLDVARGINPRKQWRVDFYLDAIF